MAEALALEAHVDESLRRSAAKGYYAPIFREMRARYGTVAAIKRLVTSGDIQSGFRRSIAIGELAWTIEAIVCEHPDNFDRPTQEAAKFRLDQVRAARVSDGRIQS